MNRLRFIKTRDGRTEIEINGIDGMTLRDVVSVETAHNYDHEIDFTPMGSPRRKIGGLRQLQTVTIVLLVEEIAEFIDYGGDFADAGAYNRMREGLRAASRAAGNGDASEPPISKPKRAGGFLEWPDDGGPPPRARGRDKNGRKP